MLFLLIEGSNLRVAPFKILGKYEMPFFIIMSFFPFIFRKKDKNYLPSPKKPIPSLLIKTLHLLVFPLKAFEIYFTTTSENTALIKGKETILLTEYGMQKVMLI